MTLLFSFRQISKNQEKNAKSLESYKYKLSMYEIIKNTFTLTLKKSSDIFCSDTLAPVCAPNDFRMLSVWHNLEIFENTYAIQRYPNNTVYCEEYKKSARVALEISLSFPNEISIENRKKLIMDFAKERYVSQGLIVTYAVYNAGIIPQAQMLISRRSVDEKGELSWAKNREICKQNFLFETRNLWMARINIYLEKSEVNEHISEKNYLI